jgi:hypothetical protein
MLGGMDPNHEDIFYLIVSLRVRFRLRKSIPTSIKIINNTKEKKNQENNLHDLHTMLNQVTQEVKENCSFIR